MAWSRPLLVSCVLSLLLATNAASAPARIDLLPSDGEAQPGIELLSASDSACRVRFVLPWLQDEVFAAYGRQYHSLTIPGGAVDGEVGEPALPLYGGLLAVPTGSAVEFEILDRATRPLESMLLLPVQPDDSTELAIDPAYGKATPPRRPLVTLGEPAILHGRRVVPFVVHPVAVDAAAGTVTVETSVEIEFRFTGSDRRNDPKRAPAELPASFTDLVNESVVNPTVVAAKDASAAGPGGYLAICPDDASVVAALQPLLDWRRRQGYDVALATTAQTGTTTASIKSYLQTAYDTATVPIECVLLVGDHGGDVSIPTWFETVSGYGGEGDHYYAELEGDDVLADVFLGRLSCRSASELTSIVTKIVSYETAPPTDDAGWFTRASLTADPSQSGASTIYVSQWMKAQIEAIGFTQVDTIFSGYYSNLMLASLNQGLSIFTYRGYLGMSGFQSGHINSATNGGMLPFAIFPTCDSGSWASVSDARNEAFLRNPNGGGIGAIGLATIGTHTRYNNALFHGVCEGVVNSGDHRLGPAQARGKLEVYRQYEAFEPQRVEIWSVWSSLIGDPATDVWLAKPASLSVTHPAALPLGAGALPVTVLAEGSPVAGAKVAVFKDGEVSLTATTDAAGQALLPLPSLTAGSLLVTVWGHNLLPYLGSATLGSVNLFVDVAQTAVDDDLAGSSLGDGDGAVNPGETIELGCELINRGSLLAGAVSATLSSDDPYVSVLGGLDSFGDLAGGAAAWGTGGFLIQVDPAAPDGHVLGLRLVATSGADEWISAVQLPVVAPAPAFAGASWSIGSTLDPGETGALTVTLENLGPRIATAATGVLTTSSPWIEITDASASFGDLGAGASGDNAGDPFALQIAGDCFEGHLAAFALEVTEAGGATSLAEFTLPVGSVTSADPVGPDAYGYYAFDNVDTGYLAAPIYDWIELDPNYGGPGSDVGLTDFGYEQDDTQVLDLPFTFTYYGQDFDQIAVCSNGWIAMGNTTLVHWRNWGLPCAGSPNPLIAAFWDDLNQTGTNRVYWWHDTANQQVVVQWSRMPNLEGGVQNFEVILRDPLAWPTSTGDGEILFQYESMHNNDTSRGYATIGIQNLDGTDAVLYSYYNAFAPGAALLAPGRAILFKPGGPNLAVTCNVTPDTLTVTLAKDQQTSATLTIANQGEAGSVLRYQIDKVDPDPPTKEPGAKSLTNSSLTCDATQYTAGETVDLTLTADCVSNDQEWILQIQADLPPGVVLNSATAFSNSTLDYVGSLGDGVVAAWGGGHLGDNRTGIATINVTFGDVAGTLEIPYTLVGDEWGVEPHQISGTIVLESTGPNIVVQSPAGGEHWAEGETRDIVFVAGGGPENVTIELDRGDGSGWQTLATGVAASAGSWSWDVTGPISAHCLVRITDEGDPAVFDVSDEEFMIGRDLGWVTVGAYGGFVAAGASEDVVLDFDSTGLADGVYQAALQIANTAGGIVSIPVNLVVGGPTAVGELPRKLALERNFPNPFNPRTNIRFALPTATDVELAVFDARGHLVKVLHRGELAAGTYTMVWDGTDRAGRAVSTGLFFCRMVAGDQVLNQKMLLMK